MQIGISEKSYQDIGSLFYQIQKLQTGNALAKKAKELLDHLDKVRKSEFRAGQMKLNTEQFHRTVQVLAKIEKGDFSKETVRETTNALRHLEVQRQSEKPEWKLAQLHQSHNWKNVSQDIVKIGLNQMDCRAIDKVLHDISSGNVNAMTQDIAKLTGKVLEKYQELGNDPYQDYDIKIDPKLFDKINKFINDPSLFTGDKKMEAQELSKEFDVERTFDLRHRDNQEMLEKLLKYLAEMLVKLKDMLFQQKDLQEQENIRPAIERGEKFERFAKEMIKEINQERIPEEIKSYSQNLSEYIKEADKELMISYKTEFLDKTVELNIKPEHTAVFGEGVIRGTLQNDTLGFEQKTAMISGVLEGVYEIELGRDKTLQVEKEKEILVSDTLESLKTILERHALNREVFIPESVDLNQPVSRWDLVKENGKNQLHVEFQDGTKTQLQGLDMTNKQLNIPTEKLVQYVVTPTEETNKHLKQLGDREGSNMTLRDVLMDGIGDSVPGKIPVKDLDKEVESRIKNNILWYKADGQEFKAIKLYQGPYESQERDGIVAKALYGEGSQQKEAKDSIAKITKEMDRIFGKEKEMMVR